MPKPCPKIILEGTRLTWKTEIAFALNEHPRFVAEQALFRRLVEESTRPVLEVDVSEDNVPGAVECIADWLEGRVR